MIRYIVYLFLILIVVACKEQASNDLIVFWDKTNIEYTEPDLEDHFSKFKSDVTFTYDFTVYNNSDTKLILNIEGFFEKCEGRIKRLKFSNKNDKQVYIPAKRHQFLRLSSDIKFNWEFSSFNMNAHMGMPSRSIIDSSSFFCVINGDIIYIRRSKTHSISTKGIE